ncbi:MAG: inositol monophosphatase family protein [Chloroflexota bacterium]
MLRSKVHGLLRRVAAEVILPRFRGLHMHEIQEKTPGEIVTVVDREAERVLAQELPLLLSGSRVVGEEAAAENPDVLKRLEHGTVWLVDPLDGTANFVAGSSRFAVMVALLRDGETLASWMLDPVQDVLAYAELGHGAYLGSERVRATLISPQVEDLRGAILTGYLPAELRDRLLGRATILAEVLPGLRCAGLEYPAVALGAQHFSIFWRTLPWDHAPGALFLSEAGGLVTRLNGSRYQPAGVESGLLLAHNYEIWRLVREQLVMDVHGGEA